MFETLFSYPKVVARHRHGPQADARERFLLHCAEQGLSRATLAYLASELLVVAQRLHMGRRQVSAQEIEAAADRWARHQTRHKRARTSKWSRQRFIATAASWLRFIGRMKLSTHKTGPFADEMEQFVAFMRDERGLAAATIRHRCWHLATFLDSLPSHKRSLNSLSLEEIDTYLARKGDHGWSRVSVSSAVDALHSFFLYAEHQQWCSGGLAEGISAPRMFRQEGLPRGPVWEAVQRLIATTGESDLARDIRDHAILMFLAIYGLRSGEVPHLLLEDIDWEHEIIRVTRPKQRRIQTYPLTYAVGEAILRYLRDVRPSCPRRELFLTLKAPLRPLSPSGMYHVVKSRLDLLCWQGPGHGPHCLRHACACHLVASGFSLKKIGDHLGHPSAYATRIYAKTDLGGLRQVAEFDLRGLL
ncbi:integrase [Paraburkholderia phytofirmans OLGA172]|uniref:Integrase n=1 Tax=Paraburkholderia phytofirmans OLGA172 TaxID=1417228 RepID=A0A160FTA0_9BURK|nr:tyrosine-type recombinase/integrase [Paraburkholderia phytofirmans]ANB76380.1 integrase [Paraburkholderia phytofirmans OLGA172]